MKTIKEIMGKLYNITQNFCRTKETRNKRQALVRSVVFKFSAVLGRCVDWGQRGGQPSLGTAAYFLHLSDRQ